MYQIVINSQRFKQVLNMYYFRIYLNWVKNAVSITIKMRRKGIWRETAKSP